MFWLSGSGKVKNLSLFKTFQTYLIFAFLEHKSLNLDWTIPYISKSIVNHLKNKKTLLRLMSDLKIIIVRYLDATNVHPSDTIFIELAFHSDFTHCRCWSFSISDEQPWAAHQSHASEYNIFHRGKGQHWVRGNHPAQLDNHGAGPSHLKQEERESTNTQVSSVRNRKDIKNEEKQLKPTMLDIVICFEDLPKYTNPVFNKPISSPIDSSGLPLMCLWSPKTLLASHGCLCS